MAAGAADLSRNVFERVSVGIVLMLLVFVIGLNNDLSSLFRAGQKAPDQPPNKEKETPPALLLSPPAPPPPRRPTAKDTPRSAARRQLTGA